jgi:hypothetical protein
MVIYKKYFIISFPRSGFNLTYCLLDNFHSQNNLEFIFCNYYGCCKDRNICKLNYKYQRNHDFKLSVKINENDKYLFLYRKNKLEQLEAYFRFKNPNFNYKNPNDYLQLKKFIINYSKYYDDLVDKYTSKKRDNILVIDYNDYINDPINTFHKIIEFFDFKYSKEHIDTFINNSEKIYKKSFLSNDLVQRLKQDIPEYF